MNSFNISYITFNTFYIYKEYIYIHYPCQYKHNRRVNTIFRSMLNCVNSLEPQSMNSGIEHAALMISEEKTQHDSRKNIPILPFYLIYPYIMNFINKTDLFC